MATASVLADLDSIRNLFNEKEKELTVAVKKVDDLTHQLEELRSGRLANGYPPQVVELERLRRELAYRKQLHEQQNAMIGQQRAQLGNMWHMGSGQARPSFLPAMDLPRDPANRCLSVSCAGACYVGHMV